MTEEAVQLARKLLFWATILTVATVGSIFLDRLTGCSRKRKIITQEAPAVPPPPQTCDGLDLGKTRETLCPQGKKVEVCTASGLATIADDCAATACISFVEATQVFASNCVSCHQALSEYGTAKRWAPGIRTRINLPLASPNHMPPPGALQPQESDVKIISQWVDGGAKETCNGAPPRAFVDFDYVEAVILADLQTLNDKDKLNARYLVTLHKYDEGAAEDALKASTAALNKTLNSLSVTEKRLIKAAPIDPLKTIWRFDLEAFGLDAADWKLVEDQNRLKIISDTDLGPVLRLLTGTAQTPWLHFDNFVDITQRDAVVYYTLTNTPATIAELQRNLGVDFGGDLLDLDALFVGSNQSPIALLKNRLLVRLTSDDGYYWQTFDTVDLNGVPERNLFEFPLLAETGSQKIFEFAASEVIYSLRNGLQGYALFDAKGVRQNAAPLNIVRDNRSPITPEIKTAISCHRCHSGGLIPMSDQVRDHVVANASEFTVDDVERVKELYCAHPDDKSRPCPAKLLALFADDQAPYVAALKDAEIDASAEDPINVASDAFLLDWDINRVASFLFLTPDDFRALLNQSPQGKAKAGQLVTGGTITYAEFIEVLPIFIEDMQLFQESINGGR